MDDKREGNRKGGKGRELGGKGRKGGGRERGEYSSSHRR